MLKLILSFSLILLSSLTFAAETPADRKLDPTVESLAAHALQSVDESKLAAHPQWLNLLNYRQDFFWMRESQADSPLFFFSPAGKKNPHAELRAFIEAVFNPEYVRKAPDADSMERAQCLFPARFAFLKHNLPQVAWPAVSCPRYENFKGILDAHSATYVFSSYYMNNPASAYGHSFLRLNRGSSASGEKKYELIDFGVGFSGVPEGATPASYAIMGLMGFFQGRFEIQPYYFKVREYNNFESRDLWEYDLNLNQDEIDLLVAHVYELQHAGFDYWYFTENCSYRILAALDSVRPSLGLVDKTKRAVLPGDTMILVAETPGLVRKVSYRPSGRAIFKTRYQNLEPQWQSRFAQFIEDEDPEKLTAGLDPRAQQELLDTAIDYVDFKYAADILREKGQHPLKKKILMARADVDRVSPDLVIPTPPREAPHEAHGSSRWNLGGMQRADKDYITFGHRFALHDLQDPIRGYPAYSEMQMLETQFSYSDERGSLQLEKLGLVEIVSLSDWNAFSHLPSWRLKLAWDRSYQTECGNDCVPLNFQLGIGISKEFTQNFLGGLWLRAGAAYDERFTHDRFRIGGGPAAMLRYRWADHVNLLGEVSYRYDNRGLESEYREFFAGAQVNVRKNVGLRLGAQQDDQYKAELLYYY